MERANGLAQIDWPTLIRDYQHGPAADFGPRIIEALTPQLRRLATVIPPAPPLMDPEDVWQQLCLEALVAAAAMESNANPRWIPRMIAERAGRATARAVLKELAHIPDVIDDDLESGLRPQIAEAPPPLSPPVEARRDDAELMHRRHVLGLGYDVLAAQNGVGSSAIRKRVSRARGRLRTALAVQPEPARTRSNADLTEK